MALAVSDAATLEAMIKDGESYEAAQLFLGQLGRGRAAGQYQEAEAFGTRGVVALLAGGDAANATTVAVKVIEVLAEHDKLHPEQAAVEARLGALDDAFSNALATASADAGYVASVKTQQLVVLKAACKLAGDCAPLHERYARALTNSGHLAQAAQHFCQADCPAEYAELVRRWQQEGYAGEADLFVARAVLHLLSIGKADQARELHQLLGAPRDTPLDNFVCLVLELLELTQTFVVGREGGRVAFAQLLNTYTRSLQRDPKLVRVVHRTGQKYFHWAPPANPMQSMMSNMMKMFAPPGK